MVEMTPEFEAWLTDADVRRLRWHSEDDHEYKFSTVDELKKWLHSKSGDAFEEGVYYSYETDEWYGER